MAFLKQNKKWNLVKTIDYAADFHIVCSIYKKPVNCFGKFLQLKQYFLFVQILHHIHIS